MRKTFVVGKLTVNSTHILFLDSETSNAPLAPTLRSIHPMDSAESRLPDPHTVH